VTPPGEKYISRCLLNIKFYSVEETKVENVKEKKVRGKKEKGRERVRKCKINKKGP
jgi:hypothetical protein